MATEIEYHCPRKIRDIESYVWCHGSFNFVYNLEHSNMLFSTFQLDLPPLSRQTPQSIDAPMPTAPAGAPPTWADVSDKIEPDASTNFDNCGSFDYDQENGYTLKWDNLVKFKEWLEHETESKTIELVCKEIRPNPNWSTSNHWIEKHIYVCG